MPLVCLERMPFPQCAFHSFLSVLRKVIVKRAVTFLQYLLGLKYKGPGCSLKVTPCIWTNQDSVN